MMLLSWLKSPNIILAAIVAIAIPSLWALHTSQKQAAYSKGVEAGKGTASVAAVESATKTAAAEREALESTPIPKDKQEIVERCKRAASCRERHTL